MILASENAAIARPAPELVGLREGLGVFETRVEGRATGTTTIRLNAPARFTAPRGGATLEVRVQ